MISLFLLCIALSILVVVNSSVDEKESAKNLAQNSIPLASKLSMTDTMNLVAEFLAKVDNDILLSILQPLYEENSEKWEALLAKCRGGELSAPENSNHGIDANVSLQKSENIAGVVFSESIKLNVSVVLCFLCPVPVAAGGVVGAVTGAAAGAGLAVAGLSAIGLGPLGPVAGGLFAANMGAGIAAGSVMATVQSAAMTGAAAYSAAYAGATVGAVTGGAMAYSNRQAVNQGDLSEDRKKEIFGASDADGAHLRRQASGVANN